MSRRFELDEDRHDALQEVVNVAMGQAADALAQLLDHFVELSVPQLRMVDAGELRKHFSGHPLYHQPITAIRQPYIGQVRGEAVVAFGRLGHEQLAALMGYEEEMTGPHLEELLLDIGNVVVAACLNAFAEQLHLQIGFAAPAVLGEQQTIASILALESPRWQVALLVEIHFGLEGQSFECDLLAFLSDESIAPVMQAIDRMLEEL